MIWREVQVFLLLGMYSSCDSLANDESRPNLTIFIKVESVWDFGH